MRPLIPSYAVQLVGGVIFTDPEARATVVVVDLFPGDLEHAVHMRIPIPPGKDGKHRWRAIAAAALRRAAEELEDPTPHAPRTLETHMRPPRAPIPLRRPS
jgi:hypothetical protein